MWYCAETVYPGKRFTDYGVLGDDIVIADTKVALVYKEALMGLGNLDSEIVDIRMCRVCQTLSS